MDKLNNIILRICSSNKDKKIILYEYLNDYISKSLNHLDINYRNFDTRRELTMLDSDNLLLLSIDENIEDHKEIYRKIGTMILNHPNHIIVINKSDDSEYLENQTYKSLMSLGFKLNSQTNHDDIFFHFYTYNISSYKNTPDWLNSENWANPELWEK